jgi:hypothetical protein
MGEEEWLVLCVCVKYLCSCAVLCGVVLRPIYVMTLLPDLLLLFLLHALYLWQLELGVLLNTYGLPVITSAATTLGTSMASWCVRCRHVPLLCCSMLLYAAAAAAAVFPLPCPYFIAGTLLYYYPSLFSRSLLALSSYFMLPDVSVCPVDTGR